MGSAKEWEKTLPDKVRVARETAGFSLAEAANRLGFNNYQTLSNIEKGARRIKAHELSAMVDLYRKSMSYFFEPEARPDPTPLWRRALPQADVSQVQCEFQSFLENYSNLESIAGLRKRWKDIQRNYDKGDFSARNFELTETLSVEIGEHLNLGSRPASGLVQILENDLRFKILHLPLPPGVSGASLVDGELGVGILVNSNDAPWRRNYDLAHELFHIITWNVFSQDEVGDGTKKTKPEQYADAFASSLLLPSDHLRKALEEVSTGNQIRIVDIIELAIDFGVSTSAILWRLHNLRIIKKREVVEKLLKADELSEMDKSKRRDLYHLTGAPSRFPTRFIMLACRCLIEGKISRGVFAKYLEIDIADIDAYLKRRGIVEKTYEEIGSA
jgi:Zn-dependent peptidase ImmA (M78 family)/transcriptional regulator with XRE-family HTH domain